MASQVDICNAALVKIGQDVPIVSLSENTKAGRTFSRVWSRALDHVLAEHPWPFSITAEAMQLSTEAEFPGWAYRYEEPANCLTKLAVCSENGVRATVSAALDWTYADSRRLPYGDGRAPFETVYGAQATCIVTDLDEAFLVYAARVSDTDRFPPKVVEALACRLAIEVAPALAGELGLRLGQALEQRYAVALNSAIVHALNEAHPDPMPVAGSVAARG